MLRAKTAVRILLSLAVSLMFVMFSLRHTDVESVLRTMLAADGSRVAGYLAALTGIHLLRVVRWQMLLRPLGRVSFARVNSATSLGYMMLALLPLRLGELARPVLISSSSGEGDGSIPRRGGKQLYQSVCLPKPAL